jgi:hypothetical protein
MRAIGVEPTRPEGHKDLNLARLPVPPRSLNRTAYCVVRIVFLLFIFRAVLLRYFFNAFFSFLQYAPAVLYQRHSSFILSKAVLQRYLALLDFLHDAAEVLNCLLETQFRYIIFFFFVGHNPFIHYLTKPKKSGSFIDNSGTNVVIISVTTIAVKNGKM